MTACFVQAILHGHGTSYWYLLKAMRVMVSRNLPPQDDDEEGCCAVLSFLAILFTGESLTSGSRQVLTY